MWRPKRPADQHARPDHGTVFRAPRINPTTSTAITEGSATDTGTIAKVPLTRGPAANGTGAYAVANGIAANGTVANAVANASMAPAADSIVPKADRVSRSGQVGRSGQLGHSDPLDHSDPLGHSARAARRARVDTAAPVVTAARASARPADPGGPEVADVAEAPGVVATFGRRSSSSWTNSHGTGTS